MEEQKSNRTRSVISLIGVAVAVWYFLGGGLEKQAANNLQEIKQQVAADYVKQYEIAKRNGSAMDSCVQAGFVAAAYLQTKDEAHYQQWKQIQSADCASAGLRR